MLNFPSRCGVIALALTAGFSLSRTASAQIAPATDTVHVDEQGRHIAPHDTFYTLEYVSARTDKGVEGFPPGTEVKLVSVNREARTLTVTDGKANIDLPPEKLTNDMDIAALVKAKDNANQERVAAYQQAQSEAYKKYLKEVAEYTAKDLEKRQEIIRDADAKRQEPNSTSQTAQNSNNSNTNTNASSNGYYNQGGNGYGSPYGYFIDLNSPTVQTNTTPSTNSPVNQTSNNRGATSSQNSNSQTSGTRSNGGMQSNGGTQSNGAVQSSGGTTGGGGKKP